MKQRDYRKNLRIARFKKSLAQNEMAKLLGISTVHLQKLEYGKANPSTKLMFDICSILNENPYNLFPDLVNELQEYKN